MEDLFRIVQTQEDDIGNVDSTMKEKIKQNSSSIIWVNMYYVQGKPVVCFITGN